MGVHVDRGDVMKEEFLPLCCFIPKKQNKKWVTKQYLQKQQISKSKEK
jgi:hypothetical protein